MCLTQSKIRPHRRGRGDFFVHTLTGSKCNSYWALAWWEGPFIALDSRILCNQPSGDCTWTYPTSTNNIFMRRLIFKIVDSHARGSWSTKELGILKIVHVRSYRTPRCEFQSSEWSRYRASAASVVSKGHEVSSMSQWHHYGLLAPPNCRWPWLTMAWHHGHGHHRLHRHHRHQHGFKNLLKHV